MKISKLLNESKGLGFFAYLIFKSAHIANSLIIRKNKFNLLGDPPKKIYIPYHPIPESNLYGHIEVFKSYLNNYNSSLLDLHIQHGVIPGDLVQDIMKNSYAKTIITFSERRKKLIESRTGKRVIAVGPYIQYAKSRLDEIEFKKLKNNFGRTLLVFPAHSSVNRTKVEFDQKELIDKILKMKIEKNIDTVFINLFYTDCKSAIIEYYERFGFQVCSAGYWLSPNFLSNLRTIIELADYTMSNRMGTHIGYCLFLKKPHFIFKQAYHENFIGSKGNEDKIQYNNHKHAYELDSERIENCFTNEDFVITKEQIEIVNEFWGNDIYYDRNEMRTLLKV
jgi:hypothetical protein